METNFDIEELSRCIIDTLCAANGRYYWGIEDKKNHCLIILAMATYKKGKNNIVNDEQPG